MIQSLQAEQKAASDQLGRELRNNVTSSRLDPIVLGEPREILPSPLLKEPAEPKAKELTLLPQKLSTKTALLSY